jgi:hypothetical protein
MTMPRGYHPCFKSQTWTSRADVRLEFKSDGHVYKYTDVPLAIWTEYSNGSLTGVPWNAAVRAAIGPYTRLK